MLLSILTGRAALLLTGRWIVPRSMRLSAGSYSTLRTQTSYGEGGVFLQAPRRLMTSKRGGRWKWGKGEESEPSDIRAPKESISAFELSVYKSHFLFISAKGSQLKLSGLYSQATRGPNTTDEPPKEHRDDHAHWVAWKQLGDMPKEEAEKEYVEMVKFFEEKAKPKPDIPTY